MILTLIITYFKLRENQNILDCFSGSGTIITYFKLRENQNRNSYLKL